MWIQEKALWQKSFFKYLNKKKQEKIKRKLRIKVKIYLHLHMLKEKKKKVLDIAYTSILILKRQQNLQGSLGNTNFRPHLITGAAQADYAILEIDTTKNIFANTIQSGMLKEKLQFINAILIKQIIVALKKMDQINWDQKQYQEVKKYIQTSATKLGYNKQQIKFVQISAFQSQNIKNKHNNLWYQGLTLANQKEDQKVHLYQTNYIQAILKKYIQQGIYCEVKEVEKQKVEGDILQMKIKTQWIQNFKMFIFLVNFEFN
ncbi:unnamed protein product [Paramecium sonneborni]|uniref:Tr-type G domain-containing protein n=1 Tax=Paramecium sonneborni TaxID=65129 RepID=A0A8S1QV24_9CILI|nr:unnamed protein product [Paramecium sonneborni]